METDINQELDLLAAAVRASVSLDDTDGQVLGYSVQTDDADPARVAAILTRRVPATVSARQRRHGVDQVTGPVHVPADPEHGMVARLCVPVRHQNRTLALLWILETTNALAPGEVQTAERTANRLADRLAHTGLPGPKRATPGDLLRRLSRGESLPAGESISPAAAHSLSITVAVPVLPPRNGPGNWSVGEASELERSLAALLRTNRACAAVYAERDHAVLHLRGPTDTVAEFRGRLSTATAHLTVTGTASANDLPEALERARAAARWTARDPALPRDTTWAHVGLHALANALPPGATPGALAPLLKHKVSGPMLLATLETYLDFAGDVQRTATALHLHRTTLYYRLNRAAELLQLDLTNGMTRTQLHLELKQRRLAVRQGP